jgi:transposase, IS30 family
MENQYKHLTMIERDRITELLLYERKTISEIAKVLGRHKSTISLELQRNSSPVRELYLSRRAQFRADQRRTEACCRPRLKNDPTRNYVQEKLIIGWSPEIIAGRIKKDHPGLSISHEAIYQYIYHPQTPKRHELINCLRRAHRKRKQRGIGRKERKTKIPNRISIDARPKIVETRRQFGHWEGDSLISSKSTTALNSLTERKSRLLLLTKLKRKGSMETKDAVISRLQHLPPEARRSLTLDNGTENTQHQEITATLGTKCFFAHPYSSWERGTNENINGLARWYLPKGTDFAKITEQQLSHIESLINNRPRKCLKFKTPNEIVFPSVALHY